ncbi:uncharacterized protein LOC133232357 [Bos javanicus]|uniref:uncharacterized protein LOC133232357 n=1 Tax=Bos javanicus TaxID=9906 RepID=UPI002AA6D9CA|nr:uncharacterized protein LOC133232357 [Bos javanicus]
MPQTRKHTATPAVAHAFQVTKHTVPKSALRKLVQNKLLPLPPPPAPVRQRCSRTGHPCLPGSDWTANRDGTHAPCSGLEDFEPTGPPAKSPYSSLRPWSRAWNQGCLNPLSLRVPTKESKEDPPRNPGNNWSLPPQKFASPLPAPALASLHKPTLSASQISGGNLGWRQCRVLEGCWGRVEPPGVGGGGGSQSGDGGRSGGQNFTPREEAPERLSFPRRKSPFRARKEGEKTLSGV